MFARVFFLLLLVSSFAFQYSKEKEYYKDNNKDIEIQIAYIDAPLINIHWCGDNMENDNTILALTSKGSVYRSDDKGRQWVKMSELFHRKALIQLESQDEKVGTVNNIIVSPVDPDLVIFTGTENISWISLDCGKSISVINSGKQLREFQFHPIQKEWILATAWNRCMEQYELSCDSNKELVVSQDFGTQWHQIATYIHQFSWGVKSSAMLKTVPKERILASFEPQGKGHQSLSSWNSQANLYYSDDFFQTRTLTVPSGARFLLTESYLFVAKVTSTTTQEVSLLVSNPASVFGYNYDVIDADQKLKEHSYSILDTSENQVFMIVNHFKPSSPMGVIYISDSTGTRYTRSLEYSVRMENNAEFYRVLGLEGIYLANVYATEQAKIWEKQVFEQQEAGFYMTGQVGFKDEDLKKYKQTKITFDKGGQWHLLKPPIVDCEGKPIKCDPKNCGLHLHLNEHQYQFGPIYSQNNSIGIIVATGSIGKYLSYRPDQVNTYLTRDGGLTWNEIHKGSHIYEISDHGGLILMGSDQEAIKQLKYSWNEGMNWNLFQFNDDGVEIQNIITEPTNRAERFIIYGSTKITQNEVLVDQGILVTVDLDRLHQRSCYGLDIAGEVGSDFELWTPSGVVNPDCLFGKKVTYIRRKREAACYNPEVFNRVISVEACPCSAEDYECDLGFVFSMASQQCLPINGTLDTTPPLQCNGYFNVSSGYRKIAGDMCKGGIEHFDLKLPCPGNYWKLADYLIIIGGLFLLYQGQKHFQTVKSYFFGSNNQEGSKQQQKKFKPIDLEDNEQGLGQQEFDEDLIEKVVQEVVNRDEDKKEVEVKEEFNDQLI